MTRWAVITIGLYMLLIVALTLPVTAAAFWGEWEDLVDLWPYGEWLYWVVICVFVLAQAALLIVPVRAAKNPKIKQRHILIPSLAAGLMMSLLVVSGLLALLCAALGEDFFEHEWQMWLMLVGWPVFFWGLWTALFWSFSYTTPEPRQWMRRVVRWLVIGSIVELLVAVGSHIVVRRRGDCSAPLVTFWGMAAGMAVMFMAFGPGVFWLFAERRKCMLSRRRREARSGDA